MFVQALVSFVVGIAGLILALPVLLATAPFVIVSHATRWLASLLEPKYAAWADLFEYDPAIGWRPVANLDTWHMVDDLYQVTTDTDGWRGRRSIDEAQMLVVGDSFAWGYGVNDNDFFADKVVDARTKALGCVGYNMVQELLWMQQLAPRLNGKLVVWLVYLANDLYDNISPHMLGYRTPFVRKLGDAENWEIVTEHLSSQRWFFKNDQLLGGKFYLEKINELCRPGFLANRAFDACRHLLSLGEAVCREAGAKLVVLTVPERSQYDIELLRSFDPFADASTVDPDYPDRCIAAICEELGLPFVATKPLMTLDDFKETDCHWNEAGHEKIATLLGDIYRQHRGAIDAPAEVARLS